MTDFKQLYEEERKLRRKLQATSREYYLEEDDYCKECGGSGYLSYADTTTWRGGIGGQIFTNDVCNKCWGSGSESRPWPRHPR